MSKIVFEFVGGPLHRQAVENIQAMKLFSDTSCGHVGNYFRTDWSDDFYEVVGRAGDADELVVLAEYRPDPRD